MSGDAGRSGGGARLPDLVYPVRGGENEELRYSLRSVAANAAGLFRKVWVIGRDLPSWLTGVEIIDAGATGGKQADVRAKVRAAAGDRRVASRIVLMTDDVYLVEPITEWEPFHMGRTSDYISHLAKQGTTVTNSGWLRAVVSTAEWMAEQGYDDILVRQGHRPLLWSKTKLKGALDRYPADRKLDIVGLYDIAGAAGVGRHAGNAKIGVSDDAFHQKMAELDIPWRSSNDKSFRGGLIGEFVRRMFPEPSPFEVV